MNIFLTTHPTKATAAACTDQAVCATFTLTLTDCLSQLTLSLCPATCAGQCGGLITTTLAPTTTTTTTPTTTASKKKNIFLNIILQMQIKQLLKDEPQVKRVENFKKFILFKNKPPTTPYAPHSRLRPPIV
jgi:hypothetical protein